MLVTILALKVLERLTWVKCPAYLGESYGIDDIEVLVMITI
jgi:hypothetical protein